MSISTVVRPSARVAFSRFIDYAGLFPPAELSLPLAREAYERARAGPFAWMLGRFILRASSLPAWADNAIELSVILDDANASVIPQARRADIGGLEVPPFAVPAEESLADLRAALNRSGLGRVPVFVEVARNAGRERLEVLFKNLVSHEFGAKLRCGGVTAEAFPSVDEVADFLAAAEAANIAFKATAGLHHPVRRRDAATGVMMHGFLNLLVACALARRVRKETLQRVVAEEDSAAFSFAEASLSWRDVTIDISELESVRRDRFVAYGSCSFAEPVEDLTALGILPCP